MVQLLLVALEQTTGAGAGGAGAPNTILGPDTSYAGGGGGGGGGRNGSAGGSGGGGAGGMLCAACISNGTAGTANTGGGGGGAGRDGAGGQGSGGAGGSGIVVLRGPSVVAFSGACVFTASTHPGGDKIAKFVASGTLTVALA